MTSTPLEAVGQYIDAFNNGDPEVMAATFDSPGSILDGMAHLTYGRGQQPLRIGTATC